MLGRPGHYCPGISAVDAELLSALYAKYRSTVLYLYLYLSTTGYLDLSSCYVTLYNDFPTDLCGKDLDEISHLANSLRGDCTLGLYKLKEPTPSCVGIQLRL